MPGKNSANKQKAEQQQTTAKIHEFPSRAAQQGPLQEPAPPYMEKKLEKPGLESDMQPRPHYNAAAYKPAGKLEGKVALVTGGDSGIGRAV